MSNNESKHTPYEKRTIDNTEICKCGNVFVEDDDYDTLGAEGPVCCPDCGNEKFISLDTLVEQRDALQKELEKHKWISVTERLPKLRTKVLTVRMKKRPLELEDGFNCPAAVAWMGEENQWWTDGNRSGLYEPTHWKPIILPEQAAIAKVEDKP